MKRIVASILLFALMFVMCACGNADDQAKEELMSKNWVSESGFYRTVYKFEDGSFIQQQYNNNSGSYDYSEPDRTFRGTYSMVDGRLTVNRAEEKGKGDSDFVAVDQIYPYTFEYTFEDGVLKIDGLQ